MATARAEREREAAVDAHASGRRRSTTYRRFFRSIDILCAYDVPGERLSYVNRHVRLLGYTPKQILAMDRAGLKRLVHKDDLRRIARRVCPSGAVRRAIEIQCRVKDAAGQWRWLEGCALAIEEGKTGRGRQVVAFLRDGTDSIRVEDAIRETQAHLRRNHEALRALAARLLQTQEEERRRISRELHDELNQQLALLEVRVDAIAAGIPQSLPLVRHEFKELKSRMAGLSDAIRHIAHRLHPAMLEYLGLPAALKSCCSEFSEDEGIHVRFVCHKVPASIPPDTALCLYRVAQEALRNVAKHSGAKQATLTLSGTGSWLSLTISDRGLGFDPEAQASKHGLGLLGMRERIRLVGGTLAVSSDPGCGTTIKTRVPLGVASR